MNIKNISFEKFLIFITLIVNAKAVNRVTKFRMKSQCTQVRKVTFLIGFKHVEIENLHKIMTEYYYKPLENALGQYSNERCTALKFVYVDQGEIATPNNRNEEAALFYYGRSKDTVSDDWTKMLEYLEQYESNIGSGSDFLIVWMGYYPEVVTSRLEKIHKVSPVLILTTTGIFSAISKLTRFLDIL